MRRWVATGHARRGTDDAVVAAVEDALAGDDPSLILLFVAEDLDPERVLVAARKVAGEGVPVIGCTTAGEIGTDGAADASVAVLALGGPGFRVATGVGTIDDDGDLRRAAERAASCADQLGDAGEHRVLLLLSDGLAGDQQEVVRGAYAAVGAAVPLVGGCAGDGLHMRRTRQLHGDRVLTGAVVAAAIASDAPLGIGVDHGWRRVGEPMVVTAVEGNHVLRLDDGPALDVYLERLGAPPDAASSEEAFTRYAMTHPLGISRRSGEEVRFIAGADFASRALVCIAQVPAGGLCWIMEGDDESVLGATDAACAEALAALDGRPALGVVAFDCIARRGVLGDEGIVREFERIGQRINGAPIAGFYTYGEIARTRGVSGFHNQTLVVLALS